MTTHPSASRTPHPIRAFIDVADLPSSLYGKGQARLTRRLVHLMLAKHADPDGTSIYPSQQTLAEECGGLTQYTLGQVIKWLESHNLVRRLPDLHPKRGTIQYELLWPKAPEVEAGKKQAADRLTSRREATRKRTEQWRSRKRHSQTVTQTISVTSGDSDANLQRSVTLPGDAVTLACDAVTLAGDACDAENPAFSASTVLLDRPITPSLLPSTPPSAKSDGGMAGSSLPSETKSTRQTSREVARALTDWMSDLLFEKTGSRFIPRDEDRRRMHEMLATNNVAMVIGAIYKFLLRPKGFCGLADPFGVFWRDFPVYVRDAEKEQVEERQSIDELLKCLHWEVFPYEWLASEKGRRPHSMDLFDHVLSLVAPPDLLDSSHLCTENV
jgi:hypothetical protein